MHIGKNKKMSVQDRLAPLRGKGPAILHILVGHLSKNYEQYRQLYCVLYSTNSCQDSIEYIRGSLFFRTGNFS